MAGFAANNYINASTEIMSFFVNNNFHLRTGIKAPQAYLATISQKAKLLVANIIMTR